MARIPAHNDYDGSEDSADRADFRAWILGETDSPFAEPAVDEDEDTQPFPTYGTWQGRQREAKRIAYEAALRRAQREGVHVVYPLEEEPLDPDTAMANQRTSFLAEGARSLARWLTTWANEREGRAS